MARVESLLPKTYHEQAGEFLRATCLNAIIHANKQQFDAIIRQSSPANVFLVVSSTRTRELTSGSHVFFEIVGDVPSQRTVPTSGDLMFHHVLSSALSTVFALACAILPAAPLFVVRNLIRPSGARAG